MCGIAGIMMRDGRAAQQAVLDRLAVALAHRGPDGNGSFCEGPVGLLSTRLAIVDLPGGGQPLREPGGVVLVANGEIYNDLDLRRELAGAPFTTGSDCESPLHLYRRKGIDCVDDLRGMYGIAIYDPSRATLYVTRDPFGIKQIYYVETPTYLAFASEPQALKAAGLTRSELVTQKRSELLQLKFTTGQATVYSDIKRLLPGETIAVKDGQIVERRRRRAIRHKTRLKLDDSTALRRLDEVLSESVTAHVRSDVPYGLFLSGGIDSATMATLMSRLSSKPVVAFTAAFPDYPAANESGTASRVAAAVHAEHHVVEVTQKDFWNFSPRVAAALDDPTTDASSLPTYMLARAARKDLTVVLSGEGADEILGGYSRYRRATSFWRLLGKRKARSHGVFDEFAGDSRAFDGWRDGLAAAEKQETSALWSVMQVLQAVDCAEWLPNDLLVKFDRCLMAHSIEGRTPFLDPHFADFAFNLPDHMKVRNGRGKWLLREWLAKNCPEADAWGKKLGFNPPAGHWIEADKSKIEALILTQPGIKHMQIEPVVRKVYQGPAKHSQAAWSLLFYALWHSHHILNVNADGSIGDVLTAAARQG